MNRTLLLLLVALTSCDHNPGGAATNPSTSTTASANANTNTNANASTSTSTSTPPLQKGECPLEIRPGVALGPVRIGATKEDLAKTDLAITSKSSYQGSEILDVGPYHANLCNGHVVDAWLDDLRVAPDCGSFAGQKLDRKEARDAFFRRFSGCHDLPPRIGGSFVECESGGLRLGFGMGEFIQVRVVKRGYGIDDSCAMLADDGKPVPLPADERKKLLQKVLDLALLAPFWHADKPGRDPLVMLKTDALGEPPALSMFGSAVKFVDRAEAEKKKLPYFELTKLESSATRVTIEFRYPVEGVVGHVVFRKRFDDWQLEEKKVSER